MSKINLTDGQDIVILTESSKYYINNAAVSVGSTFTLAGNPVTPIVDECESDGAQAVNIDPSVFILDNNSNRYVSIVGGRPRTRARK